MAQEHREESSARLDDFRSAGQPQGADVPAADVPPANDTELCDLADCSCTGRSIGKYTSPAALLAIAEAGELSGYDIAQRLRRLPLSGEGGQDTAGIYRTLRRMERFNLVTSAWDTEGGGPARRLYSLTNLGDRCLQLWTLTLHQHAEAIAGFLQEYEHLQKAQSPPATPEESER